MLRSEIPGFVLLSEHYIVVMLIGFVLILTFWQNNRTAYSRFTTCPFASMHLPVRNTGATFGRCR